MNDFQIVVTNVFGTPRDVGFLDLSKNIEWLPNNRCWPLVINLVDFLTTFAHNIKIKKTIVTFFFHVIESTNINIKILVDVMDIGVGNLTKKDDDFFMDAINECFPNLPPIPTINHKRKTPFKVMNNNSSHLTTILGYPHLVVACMDKG